MLLKELNKKKSAFDRPLLCLEVNPPRGSDVTAVMDRIAGSIDGVDFFNVTDCALARMKFAALPFGALLKKEFNIEPMVNVSCRDRNLTAIQADLLAAYAYGVRSVVALTGDAVTLGDCPERKGVFEVNSVGLLKAIRTLNSGEDLAGNKLKGSTELIPGAVVNPNARNTAAELKRLEKKVQAGARYALSQPVFDEDGSVEFFKAAKKLDIAIFMGLLPLKSARLARQLGKIPGIRLSEKIAALIQDAPDEKDLSDFSIEHCLKLAKLNRDFVTGFHVVSGATPKLALSLSAELARVIEQERLEAAG